MEPWSLALTAWRTYHAFAKDLLCAGLGLELPRRSTNKLRGSLAVFVHRRGVTFHPQSSGISLSFLRWSCGRYGRWRRRRWGDWVFLESRTISWGWSLVYSERIDELKSLYKKSKYMIFPLLYCCWYCREEKKVGWINLVKIMVMSRTLTSWRRVDLTLWQLICSLGVKRCYINLLKISL